MEGKLTITFSIDNLAYRTERGDVEYISIANDLKALADKIKNGSEIQSMNDYNGNPSIKLTWAYDKEGFDSVEVNDELDSGTKIAKELLHVAKVLVAGDEVQRQTYNKITKTKTNPYQFKQLRNVFTSDDELDDSEDAMNKVAEELLGIANELLNDSNKEQE